MSTLHNNQVDVNEKARMDAMAGLKLSATVLLRQYAEERQRLNGPQDIHYSFHMTAEGNTHTSSGVLSYVEILQARIATMEETIEHLEAEKARLEAAIPEAEIIAREYHARS